jgi:hypothetical protein
MRWISKVAAVLTTILCEPFPLHASYTAMAVSDYGAVGNGVADDTAAFNACLTANTICWVPSKSYAVGNVQLKNGNRLIGLGVVQYGTATASTTPSRPILVWNNSAGVQNILDVSTITNGAAIEGVFIDCRSSAINGISGGSRSLAVRDVSDLVRVAVIQLLCEFLIALSEGMQTGLLI